MATCPQCGLVQPDGAAFCDECGSSLSSPAPTSMAYPPTPPAYAPPVQNYGGATVMAGTCPTCNAPILPGTQFCDNCGASLVGRGAPAAGFGPGPVAAGGFSPPAAGPAPSGGQACPSCGEQLETGSTFCDMCGARITDMQQSAASSETQVQSGPPGNVPSPFDAFGSPADNWGAGSGGNNWGGGAPYQAPAAQPGQFGGPTAVGPTPYGDPNFGSGQAAPPYAGQNYGAPPVGDPYGVPPGGYDPGMGACPTGRLVLQTTNETILFPPGKPKLMIGREDPVSGVFPDIDMTNYGGDEGGVSRSHAQIYMQGGQVVLEDLQSVNFTYVNKEKLTPYQPHPLNDGDTIRIGRIKLNYYK